MSGTYILSYKNSREQKQLETKQVAEKVDAISNSISISSYLSMSLCHHRFFPSIRGKGSEISWLQPATCKRKVLRLSKSANACHSFFAHQPSLSHWVSPSLSPFIGYICVSLSLWHCLWCFRRLSSRKLRTN